MRKRYTTADLSVLTRDEARRFVPRGDGDPQLDLALAWELLYRLEPELYDRLVSAERLHPGVLRWLPDEVERIVEVGAGAGRLTLELIHRAREVVAVEPAAPLRQLLDRKLSRVDRRNRVRVTMASSTTCRWPTTSPTWLSPARPSRPPGPMAASPAWRRWSGSAGQVAAWSSSGQTTSTGSPPMAIGTRASPARCLSSSPATRRRLNSPKSSIRARSTEVRRLGQRRVPYELLGINPPRDVAFKVMAE